MSGKKTFRNWLFEYGEVKLAKRLKTARSTIRSWRAGHSIPSSENLYKIHKLTKGEVSYAMMLEPYFKK